VPNDVPAALPLIGYVAGLALGGWRAALGLISIAVLLLAIRRFRAAIVCLAIAAGSATAAHRADVRQSESGALQMLQREKFVTIVAPIDSGWSLRRDVFALRVSSFAVRGSQFEQPLTIYARFVPPPIAMAETIVAEGFLRPNERGELTLMLKSPRLMVYRGTLSALSPAAWNRALVVRLAGVSHRYATEVALVEALALGRGERLSEAVRDNYKRGGTYHLLVFSGLQIAFAAGAIALLLRQLHAPRAADWLLLLFSGMAPLFVGPTASVSRASIGIGFYALSRILKRPTTVENLWCVAALARLVVAPADLTDAAFHLTYAGAGALLFIAKPIESRRRRLLAGIVGIESVITPLTLFQFHQYAIGGAITTLMLTPVIAVMLIVSVAVCAIPAAPLLELMALLHRLATRINDCASIFSGAFSAPQLAAIVVGFSAAMIAIALLSARHRAVAICIASMIPLLSAFVVARRDVAEPTLTMFDVGQGDALAFRVPGHVILIDGGSADSRLIPLLVDRGIHHIDVVLLTHAHPDHCGGLPAVLTRLSVDALWISPRRFRGDCAERLLDAAADARVPIHLVRDGDWMPILPARIRAIVPDRTFRRAAENNSSVVLHVAVEGRSALLAGDAEREAEALLAARPVRADILKVAHHGSRTSSTPALLDAVKPRLALISCGRHNLFGHPHTTVLDALRARHIFVLRTDRDGTVDVIFHGDHFFVHHEIDTPP
jgi:competence protein ComEC